MNTNQKGELACLKLEERAIEKGAIVSRPTIECRYDRIVDTGDGIKRIQVKYADSHLPRVSGSVLIGLRRAIRKKDKGYDASEIDALVIYLPCTGKLYWLKPEQFNGKTWIVLRFEASKNGQTKNCLFAKDFEW